jgi:hypothetical protein
MATNGLRVPIHSNLWSVYGWGKKLISVEISNKHIAVNNYETITLTKNR